MGETCFGGNCFSTCTAAEHCDPSHDCYTGIGCTPDACEGIQCPVGMSCFGGHCFDGCLSDTDCQEGERCFSDDPTSPGTCRVDACADVSCPVDEVCYGGSCFAPCTAHDDCDPEHQCYTGLGCATDACDGVQCATGETCYAGQCYQTGCTTDADCDDGTSCYLADGSSSGICSESACADVVCRVDEACFGGNCYRSCTAHEQCDPGHVCYTGIGCAADACDGVLCTAGKTCVGGTCYDDACTADADCDEGLYCFKSNASATGTCRVDACLDTSCPLGQFCYAGGCFDECSDLLPCAVGACWEGRCVDDACDDVVCPSDEVCSGGACVPSCTSSADCGEGACYARDLGGTTRNVCVADPCDGVTCGADEVCHLGACRDTCAGDWDCDVGRCYTEAGAATGTCASTACSGLAVPVDGVCRDGAIRSTCTDRDACGVDTCFATVGPLWCGKTPCSSSTVGTCAADACDGITCRDSEVCVDGGCMDRCADSNDCDEFDSCTIAEGGCRRDNCSGITCEWGDTCVQGRCQPACTVDDPTCADGETCRFSWGELGWCGGDPACDGIVCGEGQVCRYGGCFHECATDDDCDAGDCYASADGTKRCTYDACDDISCPLGEVCVGGACKTACESTADCGGDPCRNGACVVDVCDIDCPVDEACFDGGCYEACNTGNDCRYSNHDCFEGRCAENECDAGLCGDDQICVNGTCRDTCYSDLECDGTETCEWNNCAGYSQCMDVPTASTAPSDPSRGAYTGVWAIAKYSSCTGAWTDVVARVTLNNDSGTFKGRFEWLATGAVGNITSASVWNNELSLSFETRVNNQSATFGVNQAKFSGTHILNGRYIWSLTGDFGNIRLVRLCAWGECESTCATVDDCPYAEQQCVSTGGGGVCAVDLCANVSCGASGTCVSGTCKTKCPSGDCAAGLACYSLSVGPVCLDETDACADISCLGDTTCYHGSCVAPCDDPSDCADGLSCFDGRCAESVCDGVSCPGGAICLPDGDVAVCEVWEPPVFVGEVDVGSSGTSMFVTPHSIAIGGARYGGHWLRRDMTLINTYSSGSWFSDATVHDGWLFYTTSVGAEYPSPYQLIGMEAGGDRIRQASLGAIASGIAPRPGGGLWATYSDGKVRSMTIHSPYDGPDANLWAPTLEFEMGGNPGPLAFAPDNTMWIVDNATFRLRHFTTDGVELGSFPLLSTGGTLQVTPSGLIYLCDAIAARVYTQEGQLVHTFELPCTAIGGDDDDVYITFPDVDNSGYPFHISDDMWLRRYTFQP